MRYTRTKKTTPTNWWEKHICDECKCGTYDENPLNRAHDGGYTLICCGKWPLAKYRKVVVGSQACQYFEPKL